jgi:uncharacterized membrane protein
MYEEVPVIDPLAVFLGINSLTVGIIIVIVMVTMIYLSVYLWSGSNILSAAGSMLITLAGVFLGMIPIWTALLLGLFLTVSLSFHLGGYSTDQIEATNKGETGWQEYGNRLKESYAAKFGGRNLGFEDEVDKRIAIMQNLKNGFSRTLARDWLKRIERFTETKLVKED